MKQLWSIITLCVFRSKRNGQGVWQWGVPTSGTRGCRLHCRLVGWHWYWRLEVGSCHESDAVRKQKNGGSISHISHILTFDKQLDYYATLDEKPVLSQVKPNYLRELLPKTPPKGIQLCEDRTDFLRIISHYYISCWVPPLFGFSSIAFQHSWSTYHLGINTPLSSFSIMGFYSIDGEDIPAILKDVQKLIIPGLFLDSSFNCVLHLVTPQDWHIGSTNISMLIFPHK